MTGEEARFMLLKVLSQEEVTELHRREREAGLTWREASEAAAKGDMAAWERRGEGWVSTGAAYLQARAKVKPPFWDPRTPEAERNRQVAVFLESAVVRRAFVLRRQMEKPEWEGQHEADWLVFRSAPDIGVSAKAAAHVPPPY
jgi:hypothetical protein